MTDLDFPLCIILTDGTYKLVNHLIKKELPKTAVDEGLILVWIDAERHELISSEEFHEKYSFITILGTTIYQIGV